MSAWEEERQRELGRRIFKTIELGWEGTECIVTPIFGRGPNSHGYGSFEVVVRWNGCNCSACKGE